MNRAIFRPFTWLLLAAALIIVTIGAALFLYSTPFGTGEYRDSPNGRYQARAFTMHRNVLFAERVTYLEFTIVDLTNDQNIWHATRELPPGASIDYGNRQYQFIEWAADSSAVTFALEGGRSLTIPIP